MRVWVDASTLIALESNGEVLVLRDLLGQIAIPPPIADEVFTGRESQPLREAQGSGIEGVPSGATGSGGRPSAWGLARHPCSRRRKETASSSTRSRHGPLPRRKVESTPASSAPCWLGSRPARSPPPARGRSWRSWPEARSG